LFTICSSFCVFFQNFSGFFKAQKAMPRTCGEPAKNLSRSYQELADKRVPQNPTRKVPIRRTTTAPTNASLQNWGTAVGAPHGAYGYHSNIDNENINKI
jgi:hypothetical protein